MSSDDFKDLYQKTLSTFSPTQRLTVSNVKKSLQVSESRAKRFLKQLHEKDLVVLLDKQGVYQLRLCDQAKK